MISMENIARIDRQDMFSLIRNFSKQCLTARDIAVKADLPSPGARFKNIVMCGMGGSGIGGEIFSHLFADSLDIPVFVNRAYTLPKFVSKDSLVVISSYSGKTEETVSALRALQKIQPYVLCVTSSGEVEEIAREKNYVLIKVPGGQPPRASLGYLFVPVLFALARLGIVEDQQAAFDESIELLNSISDELSHLDENKNEALHLANRLSDRTAIIYGSVEPNAALPTRWRNQISENAKALAFANLIPEMNHNEIVGWSASTAILDKTFVIFLEDDNNSQRIKTRIEATKEILLNNNVPFSELFAKGRSRLCRTFSLLYYADFVSFYMAVLNDVDPSPVANIDFLKGRLSAAYAE